MDLCYEKKPGWDKLDKQACMEYAEGYKAFLDTGKTERDAVEAIVARAEAKGYRPFTRGMNVQPGDKFYQVNRHKGVILAHIGHASLADGVRLTAARPVPDDIRAVGLRAHYFHPRAASNRFAVQLVGELEEPFEWIILFRYAGQDAASPPLWWRLPKDKKTAAPPDALGIAPENILLLT